MPVHLLGTKAEHFRITDSGDMFGRAFNTAGESERLALLSSGAFADL
jgi:hypothetical protein